MSFRIIEGTDKRGSDKRGSTVHTYLHFCECLGTPPLPVSKDRLCQFVVFKAHRHQITKLYLSGYVTPTDISRHSYMFYDFIGVSYERHKVKSSRLTIQI